MKKPTVLSFSLLVLVVITTTPVVAEAANPILPAVAQVKKSAARAASSMYRRASRMEPKSKPHLESLDNVELGPELGRGGEKHVLEVAGDKQRVIALLNEETPTRMNRLMAEAELIHELGALGYPVAETVVGTHHGKLALVQERFVVHSRDDAFRSQELEKYVTEQTLKDLLTMRELSQRTHTGILDFQFGITAEGRAKINDPRNVFHGPLAPLMLGHSVERKMTLTEGIALVRKALEAKQAAARRTPAALALKRPPVPANFGSRNGTPISNKDTILSEVDHALGQKKPPALELFFVEPESRYWLTKGIGWGENPFGHIALRYTLPNGEQKVANIDGAFDREIDSGKRPMMYIVKPAVEYLWGTDPKGYDAGAQHGVYHRSMISVRIEDLPPETISALDKEIESIATRSQPGGDARFEFYVPHVKNALRKITGKGPERGNCALWISKALAAAQIDVKPRMFPKVLFVKMLEEYRRKDPSNVHVVLWPRVKHANSDSNGIDSFGPASFNPVSAVRYWNLPKYAKPDAVVEVAPDSIQAEVRLLKGEAPRAGVQAAAAGGT